jgi:hypothetical protein
MTTPPPRPAPVREAARLWGLVSGGVGALVSFGVTANVLTAGQADAIGGFSTGVDLLISAIVGLITGGSAVLAAFRTASTAEPKVTPVESPAIADESGRLIPLVPQTAAGGGL